jgi:hypothetical protein
MRRTRGEGSGDALRPVREAGLFVSCSRCRALHQPENELAFHPLCRPCRRDGPMGALSVERIHVLCERAIADAVRETSPGNYSLGYIDGSAFRAFLVGRSDSDVSASLRAWVGAPSRPRRLGSSPRAPWHSRSDPLPGLGTRALGHIAVGLDTGYTHFAFCYAPSAIAAFERECRDYHGLGGSEGLDNRRHPEPPLDKRSTCPVYGHSESAPPPSPS